MAASTSKKTTTTSPSKPTTSVEKPKEPDKPPRILSLQEKLVEIRKAIPAITPAAHSDGVKYKFAKIFDVYRLLAPALNEHKVNIHITAESATHHAENGDEIYYSQYVQHTRNGDRIVWVYEADIEVTWINAEHPDDRFSVTLHAIGTNDSGPDKAKGSAWTYCLKYYFFEIFNIDQGEDDPDNQDHTSEAPPGAATNASNQQRQATPQTATQNGTTGQQASPRRLSEAQIGRLYRKAEDAGMSREQCLSRIKQLYRHDDPADLTREEYDTICRQLDEARAQGAGQP